VKQVALLVALSALLCVGADALLLGPLAAGAQARDAALVLYPVAVLLAVTAGLLGDLAALRQRRLARSVALALLTQVGLLSAAVTLPMTLTFIGAVTGPQPPGKPPLLVPDTAFIAWAFAPPVVLPLAALAALLLARSTHDATDGASGKTGAVAPTLPAQATRRSPPRLALVSLVAALYAPVAVPLALLLSQLALAAAGPPVCQPGIERCLPVESPLTLLLRDVSGGLFVLILPAVGVAIVSAHMALSRPRQDAAPTRWQSLAWWGLFLGYGTLPVLIAVVVVAGLTGGFGGE
jgi:hypothetical protein